VSARWRFAKRKLFLLRRQTVERKFTASTEPKCRVSNCGAKKIPDGLCGPPGKDSMARVPELLRPVTATQISHAPHRRPDLSYRTKFGFRFSSLALHDSTPKNARPKLCRKDTRLPA